MNELVTGCGRLFNAVFVASLEVPFFRLVYSTIVFFVVLGSFLQVKRSVQRF